MMLIRTVLASPRLQLACIGLGGVALVVFGIILARTLNLAACPLCILQRMLYLLLALEAALILGLMPQGGLRVGALVMAVTTATGAWIAGYQTWLQRFATDQRCATDLPWWESFVYWAGEKSPLLFEATGVCSEAGWKFLGLSIAEWSLGIFTGMTLLALHALLQKRPSA